jgi:hypothetical protein
LRKAKACVAIGLEHGRRIHLKLLLEVGAAGSDRAILERERRGPDPAAGAISQTQMSAHTAEVRRRRAMTMMVTALIMGVGYKATPGQRQDGLVR